MVLKKSLSLHGEAEHHACTQVFSDVTVKHPLTGIRHLNEQVHRGPYWHDRSVFPDKVLIFGTIHRGDEKALAMDMDWMIHRMERIR